MKRLTLAILLCLLMASVAFAARTPLNTISRDPYSSALVIDAETGKTLFEENADATVYPASVLKLMNLYVVLDRIEHGTLKLDEMVQVTPEAARIGGSQVYLDPKEQFTVDDLLYALMVQSANDAATALAIHIAGSKDEFIDLMNKKAQGLGMTHSHFHSVHGLPPSKGQEPDVTTARDLAILCRELTKRPQALQYTGTIVRPFRDEKFIMRNHNKLLNRVAGCDGLKTGYYDAAGFSIAATAQKNGVRIIAIVMGCKDRKVRDAKTAELLARGFRLVPPRTEPGVAVTASAQPVALDAQQVSATAVAAPQSQPEPTIEIPPQQTMQQEALPQALANPGSENQGGWSKFFMGLAAGFALFAACFFVAASLKRKSDKDIRIKRRDLY